MAALSETLGAMGVNVEALLEQVLAAAEEA